MKNEVLPPTLESMVTYDIADHEVLLAFNGDSHAELFRMWWDKHGEKAFLEWANAQKKDE